MSFNVTIPRGYDPVELTDSVLLTKGQWTRNGAGIPAPTNVVAAWCRNYLRGEWAARSIMVGRDPLGRVHNYRFGIKFADPVDVIMFKMRWADGSTS